MAIDTLWGSFENMEPTEEPVEEPTEPQEDPKEEDPKEPKEPKEDPKGDPESGSGEDPEEKEDPAEDPKEDPKEDNPETELFDSISTVLAEEELDFLDEDAKYDADAKGLQNMLRDNMEGQKRKLEADFAKKEADIRASYENASKPKFADMDTENEAQAESMLKEYYKALDLGDDEIEDKLKELKDLDSTSKEAKIAKRYLSKQEAKAEEVTKARELKVAKDKQDQIDTYIDSVKSDIDQMDEYVGFKMTNKLKKDFKEYLFKFDKDGKTQAQKAANDAERRMRLAFYDFMDYNKKDFEIKAKTEVSNEFKKKNSRFTSKNSSTKGKTVEAPEAEPETGFQKGFLDFFNNGGE